ncbi:hypothetical protein [Azospirillum endophyticum]
MPNPDDFDRMVMASLGPPGALVPPMLPPDGAASPQADSAGSGALPLGLGIVAAVLLASLAALA